MFKSFEGCTTALSVEIPANRFRFSLDRIWVLVEKSRIRVLKMLQSTPHKCFAAGMGMLVPGFKGFTQIRLTFENSVAQIRHRFFEKITINFDPMKFRRGKIHPIDSTQKFCSRHGYVSARFQGFYISPSHFREFRCTNSSHDPDTFSAGFQDSAFSVYFASKWYFYGRTMFQDFKRVHKMLQKIGRWSRHPFAGRKPDISLRISPAARQPTTRTTWHCRTWNNRQWSF